MAASERIKDDLAYVRGAVERSGDVHVPAVYLMWAAICLVGFSMPDFITNGWVGWSYSGIGWYWAVLGPAGFIASWWLSSRAHARAGQVNRRIGIRWGLHWAAFGATGVLGAALGLSGHVGWEVSGVLWVLLLALSYTLAGVHLERRLLPIGYAGSGLPDNPVSASLRVDSCWGAYGSRTDSTGIHRSARKWNRKLDPDIQALDELAALNGLLEHRVRLAICVLLSAHDALSFTRLKQALGETDGSLGAHLRKLEDSEYVSAEKTYRSRRPVTWYQPDNARAVAAEAAD